VSIENKQVPLSIGCPSEEAKEELRKILKKLAVNEDMTSFDFLMKILKNFGKNAKVF